MTDLGDLGRACVMNGRGRRNGKKEWEEGSTQGCHLCIWIAYMGWICDVTRRTN